MVSSVELSGVVEVQFTPAKDVNTSGVGFVEQVRLYERRGAVFSDRILLNRDDFVRRIRTRKIFVTGKRKPYLGAVFETRLQIHLTGPAGKEMLVAGNAPSGNDHLEGVPEY